MQPETPDFREKLEPLRRRWMTIVVIVVAITALTYYHFKHQPPSYIATANIFVPSGGSTPVVGTDPEQDPSRRLANAAALMQTPAIANQVAKSLHYQGNPLGLLGMVKVTPSASSDFLAVTATSPNAKVAAAVANGFATTYVAKNEAASRASLNRVEGSLEGQLAQIPSTPENAGIRSVLEQQLQGLRLTDVTQGVQRVDLAFVPGASSNTSPTQAAIFAALLGLVLACGLVYALEAYSRRLRHQMVEAAYGLPLLASIPFTRSAYGMQRSSARPPAPMMEQVRSLRTMLEHGGSSGLAPRTLLVTSAIPGEGKSTLVTSLALAYLESARSVLVVDADLRRPRIHEYFEAPLAPGLSEVLTGAVSLSDAVQVVQPADIEPAFDPLLLAPEVLPPFSNGHAPATSPAVVAEPGRISRAPVVHLLTAGSGTSDPAALFGTAQLRTLLTDAAARFDVVIVDSPPVLPVSDAIPLATAVDAVVVVARSEFTTRNAAQRCRQALERVSHVTVLGVVANAVKKEPDYGRTEYYATPTA